MTRIFYDSTTIDDIPKDAQGIFAYVNGKYANVGEARQKFPHIPIGTIAVSDDAVADILDVERGDATPQQAPGWVTRMRALGRTPYVYCSLSAWSTVLAAFRQANVAYPLFGIADYDNIAQPLPGAAYKQFGGNLPGHYDMNIVADYLPGIDPPQEDDVQISDQIPFGSSGQKTTVGDALGNISFFAQQDLPRLLQQEQANGSTLSAIDDKLDTLIGLLTPKV